MVQTVAMRNGIPAALWGLLTAILTGQMPGMVLAQQLPPRALWWNAIDADPVAFKKPKAAIVPKLSRNMSTRRGGRS